MQHMAPTQAHPELHSVTVDLGPRSYDVLIGSVASQCGSHVRKVLPSATSAALVFDPVLPTQYADAVANSLRANGFQVHLVEPYVSVYRGRLGHPNQTPDRLTWESCEKYKTVDVVQSIVTQVAEKNLSRTDPIISLGGGILSDLAGFAAASYRRGVPWVNIPTTLLSMVDATVGGKTGANLHTPHGLLKNMVGAFHQPKLVLIDPAFLLTLPKRELAAGFAECIKHAMIAGGASLANEGDANSLTFAAVREAVAAAKSLSSTNIAAIRTMSAFIHANVSLKARIVERDEFETSTDSTSRMLLNLGHTFAHALESVSGAVSNPLNPTSPINHGEAVALGLIAATACAAAMNLVPASQIASVKSLIDEVPLPSTIQSLPDNSRMIELMHADKKTLGKTLRVIFPTGASTAAVFTDPSTRVLEAGWNAIRG
ncbi:MAG: 3-dehydroquinate synthase family protein [Phycisphaerales bacterium]